MLGIRQPGLRSPPCLRVWIGVPLPVFGRCAPLPHVRAKPRLGLHQYGIWSMEYGVWSVADTATADTTAVDDVTANDEATEDTAVAAQHH